MSEAYCAGGWPREATPWSLLIFTIQRKSLGKMMKIIYRGSRYLENSVLVRV